MRKAFAALALLFIATSAHAQCDLSATTANFAAQLSAVQPGQTLCLTQSASYGKFNGVTKTGMVVIQPAAGAVPTFSGGDFSTSVRFFTVKNIEFKGPLEVHPPNGVNMHVILDGVTFANVGHADHEGRLSIIGGGVAATNGNGFQVLNSFFGPGGCSDGIQDSTNGSEIGPNNVFRGIKMGGCSEHVDSIQPYASNNIHIHDNLFEDDEQGIMSPDGLSRGYMIENNVIQLSTGYPCMHIGDSRDGQIVNNVCRNGPIRVYGGNQNVPSQNMRVQNNVASIDASACNGCTISNNASVSSVTFVGGTGRCAWATKTPTGTGTNGTTVGLNTCGTPPPPGVSVTVAPSTVTKQVNQTQDFVATVTGTPNTAVTWTATCGTVTSGFYTFPAAPATCTVKATSVADTSKSGSATAIATAVPPPDTCTTSTTSFQNKSFTTQTGSFTVEYEATPAAATMDAVIGLSNGPATSYNSNATATRFESGRIEVRSGNDYLPIPNATFTVGTTYHFKLVVRISTHTYDVIVNPVGSGTLYSLMNNAFRFEQNNVTQLNNWSQIAMTGSQQVCNFTVSSAPPPPPTLGPVTCVNMSCTITQTGNPSGTLFPVAVTGPNGLSANGTATAP